MVGTALIDSMSTPKVANSFHPKIFTLKRKPTGQDNEIYWDPYEMRIDLDALEAAAPHAVVHLAGENIGSGEGLLAFTGRWTERKQHMIMESRRRGTQLLSNALAALDVQPRVLVSASGIGYYGDGGDEILTEDSPWGGGRGKRGEFLADVARVWEEETAPAAEAGIRVVNLRMGVILSSHGGALAKLIPPFSMCAGGVIGSGEQYMSWISLHDAVRAIEHAMRRSEVKGAINTCSPNPVTNAEFTRALGSVLHRPTVVPMPEAVVKAVFGQMGEETLLVSQRGISNALRKTGFVFQHPDIEGAIKAALA
jgi:hypothetical protein